MNKDLNDENHAVSRDYHAELYEIMEKIKDGHCSTLRECLLRFENLWAESHGEDPLISHQFQKEIEKLSQKDPEQYAHLVKKMEQIAQNPLHYKPLSGDLHGARRAHVGDFIIIYGLDEARVVFIDYNHHDHVYDPNR